MNFQNFIKRFLPLISLIILFVSCKNDSSKLTLVFPNKVNYETFIIAKHLGYFQKTGNDLKIITVNSGINAAEALALGSADIAAMGDGPAVILMSQDKKISVVSRYAKGERIHRLISDTAIQTAKDLSGKRIGIQIGSSTHAAFLGWIEKQGVSIDDITIIPMNPLNMPEAMKSPI